ncbi:MAG: FAD binding domain-containing protein [Enhygromyxa sp.]
MIRLPKSLDEAMACALEDGGVFRAGGTDLQERRQHLAVHGRDRLTPIVDLRDVPGLDSVTADASGAWIGGLITLAALAEHPGIEGYWPGVAEAAGALANPQIRAIASLAGNLMQAPRCWYYRHPDYECLRKGGSACFAREGDHLWHVCFDRSPCVAPHPSTLAMALMAYEAMVEYLTPSEPGPKLAPVSELLEAAQELPEGEILITTVRLGPPLAREQTAYVRASNRAHAEWALVEVTARLVLAEDGRLEFVRLAAGGVAPTPLRLLAVEAALQGQAPEPATLARAAALAREGAKPLPMTGYKLDLLEACVLEAIERALLRSSTPAGIGDR